MRAFLQAEIADSREKLRFWLRGVVVLGALGGPLVLLGTPPDRVLLLALVPFTVVLVAWTAHRLARDLDWVDREELLRVLLRMEEAAILFDGALQTYVLALKSTGREPEGAEGAREFARMERGRDILMELMEHLGGSASWRFGGRVALLGGSHLVRFSQAYTELQRLASVMRQALALVKRGGPGGEGSARERVAALARDSAPIPAAISALVAAERAETIRAEARL
jgi:hypothetical protein